MHELAKCIRDSWIDLNDGDIRRVEESLSLTLPVDYVKFLTEKNGGNVCIPCRIDMDSEEAMERLIFSASPLHFLSVCCPDALDWRDVRAVLSWLETRLPDTAIPIVDLGEDYLLLDCISGAVQFWESDTEGQPLIPVSSSFAEFVDGLEVNEEALEDLCSEVGGIGERYIVRHEHKSFEKWMIFHQAELFPDVLEHLFNVACTHHNAFACSKVLDQSHKDLHSSFIRHVVDNEFADGYLLLRAHGVADSRFRAIEKTDYLNAFRDALNQGHFS
jgi:hypothetical protein